MTVSELISLLQQENPDADVHYAHGSGDHWRTTLCPTVDKVDEGFITFTDYHRTFKLIEDQDEDDVRTVVVIS
jgi:hypothetical protein